MEKSTSCMVLTGKGRGAVAVVGVRGSKATHCISKCFKAASNVPFEVGQVRFGHWRSGEVSDFATESVVVTPIADHEYEIHCHGGSAAVSRILDDLQDLGAMIITSPSDYFGRPLLIEEATRVLTGCTTTNTAAIALSQMRGAMLDWASESINMCVSGEKSHQAIRSQAAKILESEPIGQAITYPFRVVLCGAPNVGKSSLLNSIVGYDRSITFDEAGTTRDVLHAETVIDGWPVKITDTAGIRDDAGTIEKAGIEKALTTIADAQMVIHVSDSLSDDHFLKEHSKLRERVLDGVTLKKLLNKSDQIRHDSTVELKEYDFVTSAIDGEGITDLMKGIVSPIASVMPKLGSPIPITDRQALLLQQIADSTTSSGISEGLKRLLNGERET